LTAALPAAAQLDKQIAVPAGSAEDKALSAIDATKDLHQKLGLIDKFATDHPTGDMALAADELYVTVYFNLKNYAKAYEYGDKAFVLNPDDLEVAIQLIQAGQAQGSDEKVALYGQRVVQMVSRYKAAPAPAGVAPADWDSQKQANLARDQDQVNWAVDALYRAAVGLARADRTADARTALTAAASIDTPSKTPAEEALKKLAASK
jgi:tetratricopeptide (TPR) repeat protein